MLPLFRAVLKFCSTNRLLHIYIAYIYAYIYIAYIYTYICIYTRKGAEHEYGIVQEQLIDDTYFCSSEFRANASIRETIWWVHLHHDIYK